MKILVYSHSASFYGAPKSILDLTNELKKDNRYEIIYIIPEQGQLEKKTYSRKIQLFDITQSAMDCIRKTPQL